MLLRTNYVTAYKERNYNLDSLFVVDVKTHAAKILNLMKDPIDWRLILQEYEFNFSLA
jgi:hypothetical protein